MSTPFDGQPILIADSPDESPLSNGGKFTNLPVGIALRRFAGKIVPINDGAIWLGESLWNPERFTDISMCWIVNNYSFGGPIAIKFRADATGLDTFYEGRVSGAGGGTWEIWKRVSGGTETLVGGGSGGPSPVQAFDRIGFAAIGTALTLWYQARISSPLGPQALPDNWVTVVSATDSDITDPGYMTLRLGGSETEVYQGNGGALFPFPPGNGGGNVGPRIPSFNVSIRTGGSKGSAT